MDLLIADTFTDSLARLTGNEQKAVKTTAFDLQAIYRYLDCGDLNNGFACLKCRLQSVILTSIPY